jgi:hypothetical protein
VTPEQGDQLTSIEMFINKMIPEVRLEGFDAYTPRVKPTDPDPAQRKPVVPVFGRRTKKYSNRP